MNGARDTTLPGASRRTFLGQLAGGVAATTLAGASSEVRAAAAPPSGADKAPDDEAYWQWIADQFLIDSPIAYMNTGTRGPSPRSVIKAQVQSIEAYDRDRLSYATYVDNEAYRDRLRNKLATFVGCQPKEIAFTRNTTEGMVFGTMGLDLAPGDEIIYTNHDHSSGAQPINLRAARYGIKPVVVDLSSPSLHPPKDPAAIVAAFEAAVTPRTKLISFCHMNYTDGCTLPVKEICAMARAKGILTLIDGAHPPGMIDLDIASLGCDMYAGACHKWLMASMLTGFFYVRESVQPRIWPTLYSGLIDGKNMFGTAAEPGAYLDKSNSAARYEIHGSDHYASIASVDAALDFHNTITCKSIEARDRYLAAKTRAGLRDIRGVKVFGSENPALGCAIVPFKVRGVDTIALNEQLWARHRIYIRNVTKPEIDWDVNRASLHLMVTAGDVDRLVGAVREIAREARA